MVGRNGLRHSRVATCTARRRPPRPSMGVTHVWRLEEGDGCPAGLLGGGHPSVGEVGLAVYVTLRRCYGAVQAGDKQVFT